MKARARETRSLIEFTVAGESYAIPTEGVEAVIDLSNADANAGTSEREERFVSAADLLGVSTPGEPKQGIRFRTSAGVTLLAVDRVEGLRDVEPDACADPPPSIGTIGDGLLRGLVRVDDRLVVLLNSEAI